MNRKLLVVCSILLILNCVFDSEEEKKQKDSGTYNLQIDPTEFVSYPKGAELILVNLEPDSSFTGTVKINVETPGHMTTVITNKKLTSDSPLAEIEIYIDSIFVQGTKSWQPAIDTLLIISTHSSISDTTMIKFGIGPRSIEEELYTGYGKTQCYR